MTDRAAAAVPFAEAAGLLEDLAGVRLTARRVERAAEASGAAQAAALRDRAPGVFCVRARSQLTTASLKGADHGRSASRDAAG